MEENQKGGMGWAKKEKNKNKIRLDLIRDIRAEETSQKSGFSWKSVKVVVFFSFFSFFSRGDEVRAREGYSRREASVCWCTRAGPVAW